MTKSRCSGRVAWLALFMMTLVLPARAQDCTNELEQAEEHYDFGRFDDAISVLDRCLKKQGVPDTQREQALRLKGLSYVGKDLLNEAKDMIRQLLLIAPNYQPNPSEDPPSFVTIVDEVKQENPRTARNQGSRGSAQEDLRMARSSGSRWSFHVNLNTAVPVTPDEFSDFWGLGYGLGGGIGYALTERLGVRLYLAGTAFPLDDEALLEESGFGGADVEIDGGNVITGTFMLEGDFKLGSGRNAITPYVVGGIGGFSLSLEETTVEGIDLGTEDSETATGISVGGGLTFAVKDNLGLFVEARYVVGFTEDENTAMVPFRVGFTFGR